MHRFGLSDTVVRTALSRLAADGTLNAMRHGRRSAYALTPRAEAEFRAAIPRIYGPLAPTWDGYIHLAFPEPGTDRTQLDQAGFTLLAPGVLLAPTPHPPIPTLAAAGDPTTMRDLAARAWSLQDLRTRYVRFLATFTPLHPSPRSTPLDALATRTLVIHAWRRISLRDPHLPDALLPSDWPGPIARHLAASTYASLTEQSETWLDQASAGAAPLPRSTMPVERFT